MATPTFLDSLASSLNADQYEAVTAPDGPLLILAGAGSGKTRVLVHRIAYLISTERVRPWEVFAVTFTTKAALEMRTRIERLLGREVLGEAWIGTFHSLCKRIVRGDAARLGLTPNFAVFDEDAARKLLARIADESGLGSGKRGGVPIDAIADAIERVKNRGLGLEHLAQQAQMTSDPAASFGAKLWPRYEAELRRANALDFADLLLRARSLLREHDEVLERYATRFRLIACDEAQDTCALQSELLDLLSVLHGNLTVVGDDSQAVYSFRGADPHHLLRFAEEHPGARVVKLERNYRSTRNILAAANAVIAANPTPYPKTLRTSAPAGADVEIELVETGEDEAQLVAERIEELVAAGGAPSSIAVLYRTNAQARPFIAALRRRQIPSVAAGATSLYERREVKDLLAYLRVVADPKSRAFDRIANVPPRNLGDATLERLRAAGARVGLEGSEVLVLLDAELATAGITPLRGRDLRRFDAMLGDLRGYAAHAAAADVARAVLERTRYAEHLEHTDREHAEERLAYVQELVSSIEVFEAHATADLERSREKGSTPLAAYLEEAELLSSGQKVSRVDGVALLTIHACKGLEFSHVFLVGLEEGILPSRHALDAGPEAIEEERRLCYVGMTRARETLTLTAARRRRLYGREETRSRSRFLADLAGDSSDRSLDFLDQFVAKAEVGQRLTEIDAEQHAIAERKREARDADHPARAYASDTGAEQRS